MLPGNIDIWALGCPKNLLNGQEKGTVTFSDYHHADLSLFENTDIELHYSPTLDRNLFRNIRLQSWFKKEGNKHILFKEDLGFCVPDYVINTVLVLNHNFGYLMYEGG